MNTFDYLSPLFGLFEERANASNAVQMEKYMRNKFSFYGVKSPERKGIVKLFKAKNGLIPIDNKHDIISRCWQAPQRELQYVAMELLRKSAKSEDEYIILLYEFMIITKSWWDTVDFIASNLVGVYFNKFPHRILEVTARWMSSGNIWLQRTCVLFQLKYKQNTNFVLLKDFILPLTKSDEFFIQKSIGWALREYSKTNKDAVVNFVKNNELKPLSRREALLWINK